MSSLQKQNIVSFYKLINELEKIIGKIFQNNKLQNNKSVGVKTYGN